MRGVISILLAIAAVAAARMPLVRAGENPRSSAVLIDRGLAAETARDFHAAERELLTAAEVDHQYLPAWTLANYYFRRGDREKFWTWAARAASLSYDDPAPLLQLADTFDPGHALTRLGHTTRLQRAYLDFLIRAERWEDAMPVAEIMSRDAANFARLRVFTTRLIAAHRGADALEIWNRVADRTAHPPTGEGFDWKLESASHVTAAWYDGDLEFSLDGHQDDIVTLAERTVMLDGGEFAVRYRYAGGVTGLHWALDSQVSGPLNASPDGRQASQRFTPPHRGLARLVLFYRRDPGAVRAEGRVQVKLYE